MTAPFDPLQWRENVEYLHAIDLYNGGHYWECHEVFEAFWRATDRASDQGRFFQGLIQVAAANLKRAGGAEPEAQALAARALQKLDGLPSPLYGVDLDAFRDDTRAYFAGTRDEPAPIRLALTPTSG